MASTSSVGRFQTGWISMCSWILVSTRVANEFSGWIPFLGYHHVLMILIAIAIILLCKLYFIPDERYTI